MRLPHTVSPPLFALGFLSTIAMAEYVDCYGSLTDQLCFRVCEHSVWKLADKSLKIHSGVIYESNESSFLAEDHNSLGPKVTVTLQNKSSGETCSMILQKHSRFWPKLSKPVSVIDNTCSQYGAKSEATLDICLTASLMFLFSEVERFDTRTDGRGLCLRDGFYVPGFEDGTGSGIVTFNPEDGQCPDPEEEKVKTIDMHRSREAL
ncbi:hypothetical protein [Parendozoicomonas sp. Alg238-R29]|uniref:hypothetical protein n=1 Tax=Parendozoicomonas sp. Alg238-R29 TaxID=2993446 RepID=UPI00248DF207|nr:hypothetical protein [Parendozoicomonas sp. Alg238-R29]